MKMTVYKCNDAKVGWGESAGLYSRFGRNISFYKKTNHYMFNLVDLDSRSTIVDLGCGSSGVFANKSLKINPNLRKIYCVDSSYEMVKRCSEITNSSKIVCLQSPAEYLDRNLPEKIDAVICNSSFWLFDLERAAFSINNSLKKNGVFVFNIGEWDYGFDDLVPHPIYQSIQNQLSLRKLGKKILRKQQDKLDGRVIERCLCDAGFSIVSSHIVDIEASSSDWMNFYSIPTIISKSLPHLPLDVAKDILLKATMDLSENDFRPIRWIYFKSNKN